MCTEFIQFEKQLDVVHWIILQLFQRIHTPCLFKHNRQLLCNGMQHLPAPPTCPSHLPLLPAGSGTTIAFNPMTDHLFIVGTEEGKVYKCSKAYTGHFLGIYEVSNR